MLVDHGLTCIQEAFAPRSEQHSSSVQPAVLSDDSAHVASLCNLLAVFLGHGLASHR